MTGRFSRFPLFVLLIAVGALAMWLPAIHAASLQDWPVARAFAHSGTLFLILCALLAVATRDRETQRPARNHLITLVAAYSILPAMLAVPFHEAVGTTRFLSAWFEMVSSFTTTGATLYEAPRLPPSVHLWRALVGWMGGFLILVAAIAIFAPMNLGGFEVISGNTADTSGAASGPIARIADGNERMLRFASQLLPIYGGLTLVLWIGLTLTGQTPLNALCLAMSTLATSGIVAQAGPVQGAGTEFLIFLFLIFALSRRFFGRDALGLVRDPWANSEVLVAIVCVAGITLLVFLRHWLGAFEVADEANLAAGTAALWGTLFTALSFLTTTGFESGAWVAARDWSGLDAPGLVLMGLALFGGGVATTAGGVKLLRIFALYAHGKREIEKLIHPHSVGGAGAIARRIRRTGAQVAWIFFMLMALSIAFFMGILTILRVDFASAMVLTLSALTTTGPLAGIALDRPQIFAALGDLPRAVLAVAMILGRLETLAFVALLNPDLWRR